MYINEVIPLANLPRSQAQILSYFSSQKLNWGSLVAIPLAKRTTNGIIVSSKAIESKINIKKSGFALKPLKETVNIGPVITKNQYLLIEWLVQYYYLPITGLFRVALPDGKFFKKMAPLKFSANDHAEVYNENTHLFQDDFSFLKQKIKEAIKNNRQTFILFPNQIKLEIYKERLSELSEEIIVFNKSQSQKALEKIYADINQNRKKIIMGLRSSVFAPFYDLGLIVVVDEENPSHETWEPQIQFSAKKAAEKLVELYQSQLVFISANPSLENWLLIRKGLLAFRGEMPAIPSQSTEIVDLRKNASGTIIAQNVLEEIKEVLRQEDRVLVVVNRRGLAPALVCEDCGFVLKCPNCEAAMVYHYLPPIIELRCHHCGLKKAPTDLCPNCQSHLIKFFGVATQKAVNFFQKNFPDTTVEKFDSDSFKNIKAEKECFSRFNDGQTQILVVTELFFKFLDQLTNKINLSVLASAEQILAFPDFRSEERLKRILQKLSFASNKLVVQTFNPEKDFFQNIHNLDKFYSNELELRSRLFYPPYSEIIKITVWHHNLAQSSRLAQYFYQHLNQRAAKLFGPEDYKILPPAPAFIPKVKNRYAKEIFLRFKRDPAKPLSLTTIINRNKVINFLPNNVSIKINPINLL
ncbi:MAG: primosomal protein N' [bacterium]|nr:primosomal protein N' [bacterium]